MASNRIFRGLKTGLAVVGALGLGTTFAVGYAVTAARTAKQVMRRRLDQHFIYMHRGSRLPSDIVSDPISRSCQMSLSLSWTWKTSSWSRDLQPTHSSRWVSRAMTRPDDVTAVFHCALLMRDACPCRTLDECGDSSS